MHKVNVAVVLCSWFGDWVVVGNKTTSLILIELVVLSKL